MDVFPDTQLLHGGLSTRLPCKSMEQMHCPGVTVHFSCPGGYFTIDFDFSNSPIVSLTVLRIAAATTCAFPFEGEYCVNCNISRFNDKGSHS